MTETEIQTITEFAANAGAIVTGLSTLAIALSLAGRRSREKRALENYLMRMSGKRQRESGQGLENIVEVMRQTKLSEEAIMRAAFSSDKVRVRSRLGPDGRTSELVFGYGNHDQD